MDCPSGKRAIGRKGHNLMCGLLAVSGKIEPRYVVALGCLAEFRGNESAGVGWATQERPRIAKIAQNPLVAFPVSLAPAIRHASKYSRVLIGHTRQATVGAVTNQNAHPFLDKERKIVWAHNGSIYNHATFGTYDVDSQALIHGIVKKDFSDFTGPIALVWIENKKLHAFRKGNPLHRGTRNGTVYLASTEDMLAQINCKHIKELPEGQLYIWDDGRLESHKRIPHNRTRYAATTSYYQSGFQDEDGLLPPGCSRHWIQGYQWDATRHCYVNEDEYEKGRKSEVFTVPHKCHSDYCNRQSVVPGMLEEVDSLCSMCGNQKQFINQELCVQCSYINH